jgi:hypothetical protein
VGGSIKPHARFFSRPGAMPSSTDEAPLLTPYSPPQSGNTMERLSSANHLVSRQRSLLKIGRLAAEGPHYVEMIKNDEGLGKMEKGVPPTRDTDIGTPSSSIDGPFFL